MSYVFVSQDATEVGLRWYPGDPVDLTWYVKDVDWHGTYTAAVRKYEDPASTQLAALTVTATYDGTNHWTVFNVTLSAVLSAGVPVGEHWWSCKLSGGQTRFAGPVIVDA